MNSFRKIALMESVIDSHWPVGLRCAMKADISKPELHMKGPNAAILESKITFRTVDFESLRTSLASGVKIVLEELRSMRDKVDFKFKKLWVMPYSKGLSLFALLDLKGDYFSSGTEVRDHSPVDLDRTMILRRSSDLDRVAVGLELGRVARLLGDTSKDISQG